MMSPIKPGQARRPQNQTMESLLSFTTASCFVGIFTVLVLFRHLFLQQKVSKRLPPEATGAWPVIGHLHQLGRSRLPHKALGAMADRFGPIFTIKFGVHRTIIVSDWEMAKECFTTNDIAFATRPKSMASELMGYNYHTLGLTPYGAYWRQIRKIVVLELLSNRRIEMLAHIRVSEVTASIKDIYVFWAQNRDAEHMVSMEMKDWFKTLVLNIVVRMLAGKRYSDGQRAEDKFPMALKNFFKILGTFVLSDAVPSLRWLDLGGYSKQMKETSIEMDAILQSWFDEHMEKRNSAEGKVEEQDFMDVMLSALDGSTDEDLGGVGPNTITKATCLALISAGTDTTMVTMTWALALMLNNPHVLEKAQEELDMHVGRERQVEESDMKNLVYLQAIIKETLRIYPAGPLSLPHESMEECVVGGYNIPKGTRLLVNLWKIHHDPKKWPNPSEFRPERFLTTHKDIDLRGQSFELIPFGSGRRVCPGISLGLRILQLTLASLLHGFEFMKPSTEPIDMSESFALTSMKSTPLEPGRRKKKNLRSQPMESLLTFTVASFVIIFTFLLLRHLFLEPKVAKRIPPEATGAWPIIGHLHLLAGSQLPHEVLGSMSDKFGPIFTIKFGVHRALVVSDWKMAKECFTTNDMVFATRPKSMASELMGYNYAMLGLAPYGPYWRQAILSAATDTTTVTLTWALALMLNNQHVLKKAQEELDIHVGRERQVEESDMKNLVYLQAVIKETLRLYPAAPLSVPHESMDECVVGGYNIPKGTRLQGWLEEHKMKRQSGQHIKAEERDIMDVMLCIFAGASPEDLAGLDADTVNKVTCLVTTDTLDLGEVWEKFMELVRTENRQRRGDVDAVGATVHGEDGVVRCGSGRGRTVGSTMAFEMVMTQSDEGVMRWKRCKRLRRGQQFELIPFGGGKKSLSWNFFSSSVGAIDAHLIHGFEVAKPSDELIDMTESFGMTNLKSAPLDVLLSPRLSPKSYEHCSIIALNVELLHYVRDF
ncbi:hypothetical protein RJ639_026333 [Escallonia herrerae]|uniref:Cytochrome P450 n=1 Tax=Escallonia herrerae TaxID=1293975 RepID=A0AA89ACB3_9ASTE|nr:hypothetical protein RJ639_026333 [Escallonia herrerae]